MPTMSNEELEPMFLPHLSDPFRRHIAIQYIQHEWRKFFPKLRGEALWQSTDAQIAAWYEMLTIRNFWDAVHGITIGFRLTSIVPWITSLHMEWTETEVPFEDLWFRGKFGPIASLVVATPELCSEVKRAIVQYENRDVQEKTMQYFELHKDDTESRGDFPIFVVRKEGKLRVIDGNGRTLKAIIEGRQSIRAAVGEPIAEPVHYEHWVPTSLLVDLVFWHEHEIAAGRETTEKIAQVIAELIRSSSAARLEFVHRGVHRDNPIHMRLRDAVARILAADGIMLTTATDTA